MSFRDRCAVFFPPIFLRLVLAIVFIWAGSMKLFDRFDATPEQAALLASHGAIPGPAVPGPAASAVRLVNFQGDAPTGGAPAGDAARDLGEAVVEDGREIVEETGRSITGEGSPRYTAAEFPEGAPGIQKLHYLTLMMIGMSDMPAKTIVEAGEGTPPGEVREAGFDLVPDLVVTNASDGSPSRIVMYLAWAAAVSEFGFGALLLVGALTRIGGLSIAVIMGVAIWLTNLGPSLAYNETVLGFLPAPVADWSSEVVTVLSVFDVPGYQGLFFQLALMAMGLALLFSGSGGLAIDWFIGGGNGRRDTPAS